MMLLYSGPLKKEYASKLYGEDEEYMDAYEEYVKEFWRPDVFAPVAQALASLAAATAARANQQVPLPPILPRGIGMVAMDVREAQANIDAARIAGNTPLVEVEQSLLAVYQNELAVINERVQGGRAHDDGPHW
jgi:hypothetical protein